MIKQCICYNLPVFLYGSEILFLRLTAVDRQLGDREQDADEYMRMGINKNSEYCTIRSVITCSHRHTLG